MKNSVDDQKTMNQLCTLVENLSVHQRQLTAKIEELYNHHEQLYSQQNQIYSQIDALFSIFSMINVRHPLPTMRGWPVSPDFVKVLISVIFEMKPSLIVEAGSGVSTIISGYCLEEIGQGKIHSLDHDGQFAADTRNNSSLHGLDSIISIHHCPLSTLHLSEETFEWYSVPNEIITENIDLLVIDGPPASLGTMARFPVLPFFYDKLSDNVVILLDDAARDAEKKIVERWLAMYDDFEYFYLDTEKGTVVLRRTNTGFPQK